MAALFLKTNRVLLRRCLTIAVAILCLSYGHMLPLAGAQPPAISDPDGMAPVGSMPGAFPEGVTSANVNAAPIAGSTLGGSGSDNILVEFPSSGPIKWTESRHNEGDIALLVGPFDPNDASYFPPTTHFNNYKPLADGEPFANTTLAWRVNRQTGGLLATVRTNGVNNGDVDGSGTAIGITNGIAYFNNGGQGWGYRMNDGVFANGGESPDLQMGIAGFDLGAGEAVIDTATTYFPYSEGWLGAWVNEGFDEVATFGAGNPGLDPSTVVFDNTGIATVQLPSIDSASDGMLFVAPTQDDNATDIAAAFPNGTGGWNVTIREDEDSDTTGQTINSFGNSFQFLYVPYSASNLIGAEIEGATGSLVNAAGDSQFSLSRTQSGEYALSVFEADGTTKKNGDDGTLILSVADSLSGSSTLAGRQFMSYEYDATSGDFIIQSRENMGAGTSQNVFGENLALSDANFYFSFVDFENPLSLASGLQCDADGASSCDVGDLDALYAQFGSAGSFDYDGNGTVGAEDIPGWLADASSASNQANPDGNTFVLGDVNLDGTVNSTDLGLLLNNFGNPVVQGWGGGNLNGDATVDSTDLGLLLNNFGFPPGAAAAVPEPDSGWWLLGIWSLLLLRRTARRFTAV